MRIEYHTFCLNDSSTNLTVVQDKSRQKIQIMNEDKTFMSIINNRISKLAKQLT